MTTIAWDGNILAADSCSWSGGTRRRVRKVFKVTARDGGRYLVAFAGKGDFAMQVLRWMRGQGERPNPLDFMTVGEVGEQCALVIDEKRRVWQLGCSLTYTPTTERIYAFGAGQDFAWGALEAGASAYAAVRIAMKRSDYAGLGVDVVSF